MNAETIIALSTLIPVITASTIAIIREIRNTRTEIRTARQEVRGVHDIVNSNNAAMVRRADAADTREQLLEGALRDADVTIPARLPRGDTTP